MKKNLFVIMAVAVLPCLCACTRSVSPVAGTLKGNDAAEAYGHYVCATIGNATKTYLDGSDEEGYAVLWQENDEISIDGRTFRLKSGAGTSSAVFAPVPDCTLPEGACCAYYPSAYDGTVWPCEQTWVEGNLTGSPMKAQAEVAPDGSIGDLHFTNEGGILRLTVTGSPDIAVKTVVLSADGLDTISLKCASPVSLNAQSGVPFHISLPENRTGYSNVSISFKDASGKVIDTKTLKTGALVIERSGITRASFEINRSTTLRVATYNVDGLPVSLNVGPVLGLISRYLIDLPVKMEGNDIYINADGPGYDGSLLISSMIAARGWDVIGLNEDFNNHEAVWTCLDNYWQGSYHGGFTTDNIFTTLGRFLAGKPLFEIDGLEFGARKDGCTFSGETVVHWRENAVYGYLSNESDCLTTKGFRFYTVSVDKDGVKADVDFIVLHAEAGDEAEDTAAREQGYDQLYTFISEVSTGNPMIVMGDYNSRYRRDRMKELYIDRLNALDGVSATDVWVECLNNGSYPEIGDPAPAVSDHNEMLDKIVYINRAEAPVYLKPVSAANVNDFTYEDGRQLSDHHPMEAEFKLVVRTK